MATSRKGFLRNMGWAAAGAAAGAPIGAYGWSRLSGDRPPGSAPAVEPNWEAESFSQSGEDLIVNFLLGSLSLTDNMTYLDIGAFHPTKINNTYFFYRGNRRGVLVEPNVAMAELLREVRPRDVTLVAGIGVTAEDEAEYFVMSEPSWNTFSREEAEHIVKMTGGRVTIQEVRKLPLLDINDVMEEHFGGAPTFVSIDTEGLDLAILQSIDYERYRPKTICAETLICGSRETVPEIPEFMATQGYVVRGQTFVNMIFVDSQIL